MLAYAQLDEQARQTCSCSHLNLACVHAYIIKLLIEANGNFISYTDNMLKSIDYAKGDLVIPLHQRSEDQKSCYSSDEGEHECLCIYFKGVNVLVAVEEKSRGFIHRAKWMSAKHFMALKTFVIHSYFSLYQQMTLPSIDKTHGFDSSVTAALQETSSDFICRQHQVILASYSSFVNLIFAIV